jgi:peptidoglycan/LPS O-acetylase OafA/YrhL
LNARTHRYPLVDSLRGIAALMVVGAHIGWYSGIVKDGSPVRPYLSRLEAGVAVFFVISGFVLYRPFVKARLTGRPPVPLRTYAWRRFRRIVPAFWVAITVVALWLGVHELSTPRELVMNYGVLQLYNGATLANVIPQGWTLCVEVAFYALLPLWAWLIRRRELLAAAGLVVAGLAYNAVIVWSGAADPISLAPKPILAALPGYLDHLGLGMVLAVISLRETVPRPIEFFARRAWLCWLIAAAAIVLGATAIGLEGAGDEVYTPAQYMARHVLNSILALGLLLPAIFGSGGAVRRFLAHPVMLYLGLVSYGIYLYHFAVIIQLRRWGLESPVLWPFAAAGGAVLLGSLSYFLVERPASRHELPRAQPPTPMKHQPAGHP